MNIFTLAPIIGTTSKALQPDLLPVIQVAVKTCKNEESVEDKNDFVKEMALMKKFAKPFHANVSSSFS